MTNRLNPGQLLPDGRLEQRFSQAKPLYTAGEAVNEANRCLYCHDAPCIKACPTSIDIPRFIKKIATGNVRGSAKTILDANILGYSCARVCPVEELCVGSCVYMDWNRPPIQIGRLQHYATHHALEGEKAGGRKLFEPKPANGRKVALIGSGPASLACAAYLALEGVSATIFEKRALPGGLNTTGIAPYKMPAGESLAEVSWLLELGVRLETGREVGRDIETQNLLQDYDAVFIGIGLGKDRLLGLPGEEGPGVFGATHLIERIKNEAGFQIPDAVKKAIVIGAGNTAIDIARELAMLGLEEVRMVYRRTESEMSGYRFEMDHARHYGVRLLENRTPQEVLREGERLTGLRVERGGQSEDLDCDWLIYAVGQQKFAGLAQSFPGVALTDKGWVAVDPATRQTGNHKVYAGGDCINGGKEVVNAVADGREAAFAMLRAWQD